MRDKAMLYFKGDKINGVEVKKDFGKAYDGYLQIAKKVSEDLKNVEEDKGFEKVKSKLKDAIKRPVIDMDSKRKQSRVIHKVLQQIVNTLLEK